MQDQKVLKYNTIMLTMVGLKNENVLIMYNKKDKQSVTVQHIQTFRMVKQKKDQIPTRTSSQKFYFMLSAYGPKQ